MRITVDMPDPLFRRAKAAAALEGQSLKDFFIEAVEARLQAGVGHARRPPRRANLPLVPSSRPGSLQLTADRIASALEVEDLYALARR
jgi:hypothetical protein